MEAIHGLSVARIAVEKMGKDVPFQGRYRVSHVISLRVTTLGGLTLEPKWTCENALYNNQ